MKTQEFIEKIKASRIPVFTLSDLSKLLRKKENYLKLYLHRLAKNQLVRIEKNKYTLRGTNPFLVATNLIFPSYLSFITAYSYYGLTNQLVRVCYVVSLKQKKSLSYEGYSIKFVKFPKERFFGFRREIVEGKCLFVAEIEKAIVDSLYMPRYCPVSETFFALKNAKIDEKKLVSYAKRMKSSALFQRLGFLLELLGIRIKPRNFKSYVSLNPTLPKKGEKNRKWKIIVNEVLE
ncbi:MAG: hypothetical protein J7K98_02140 [Candidatus Aenigmarchaeota archaeon]|nr:hypothetical protein [Candidatus Aenigmarchaeota archaeon]